jgi:hypothetical protein
MNAASRLHPLFFLIRRRRAKAAIVVVRTVAPFISAWND